MRDINILWIALCKNNKNAQPIFSRKNEIAVHKIYSVDTNQITCTITKNKPNLICFDYDFPDVSGLQLLRQIRLDHPGIPVIMLTLQHNENLAVWAFRTGVRNYLIKPLKAESVIEEINQLSIQSRSRSTKPRVNLLRRCQIPKEFHCSPTVLLSKRTIQAINYVQAHFQEKIIEKEVASICGMSVFTFSRIFHNEHHMTFREFLIKHRIMQAKEFLRNPEITITDVAQLSGFADASSFARLFRRYIGMVPSCYQRKHNN
jgi:YesN/AraC family two-component response regulator